jgi:hypothetical protein
MKTPFPPYPGQDAMEFARRANIEIEISMGLTAEQIQKLKEIKAAADALKDKKK